MLMSDCPTPSPWKAYCPLQSISGQAEGSSVASGLRLQHALRYIVSDAPLRWKNALGSAPRMTGASCSRSRFRSVSNQESTLSWPSVDIGMH